MCADPVHVCMSRARRCRPLLRDIIVGVSAVAGGGVLGLYRCEDFNVYVWDTLKGEMVGQLGLHTDRVSCVGMWHWRMRAGARQPPKTSCLGFQCMRGCAMHAETNSPRNYSLLVRAAAAFFAAGTSPDGLGVCTGSWDSELRVWN